MALKDWLLPPIVIGLATGIATGILSGTIPLLIFFAEYLGITFILFSILAGFLPLAISPIPCLAAGALCGFIIAFNRAVESPIKTGLMGSVILALLAVPTLLLTYSFTNFILRIFFFYGVPPSDILNDLFSLAAGFIFILLPSLVLLALMAVACFIACLFGGLVGSVIGKFARGAPKS